MTTLCLRRIAFEGRHGATAVERRSTRPFEVDLEIDAPLAGAERSDRLADTIDYSAACEVIVRIGTGEPHRLLESLARRMLDTLAGEFPEARFRIELRKLTPPSCPGHPSFAAVRLEHPAR